MLISMNEIFNHFSNGKPQGIIHIGAHAAEELEAYESIGVPRILWIEANPAMLQILINRTYLHPGSSVHSFAAHENDFSTVELNIANNGESSSILSFGTHAVEHPDVKFVQKMLVPTMKVDTFMELKGVERKQFDFANIDIQGAELLALKGMQHQLQFVKYLYLEVNEKHLYEGCPLIGEIDEFLKTFNFSRVLTKMTSHGWGDAFYVKTAKEEKIRPITKNGFLDLCFDNCDSSTNGEYNLVQKLSINKTIFDVGCRTDTEFLEYPGDVHYFDPIKSFIEELRQKRNCNVSSTFNSFGLSKKDEELSYYPRYQSFYNRVNSCNIDDSDNKIVLQVRKAKDYIEERNIDNIYFLKIDVEGHELEVIQGFEDSLKLVDILQFEYGGTYKDNQHTLADVLSYLESMGFEEFGYLNKFGYAKIEDRNDHYRYCNVICFRNSKG